VISKRNKRGIVVLVIFSLVLIYIPRLIFSFDSPKALKVQFTSRDLDSNSNKKKSHNFYYSKKQDFKNNKKYRRPVSKFNPNLYSQQDWEKLGLSTKQAISILKFLKYPIYSNEGLKKIYALPTELFELIKDSTFYDSDFKVKTQYRNVNEPKIVKLNVNSISKDELINIKGIGEYTASKLINFRDALGGFVNEDQLYQIWKIDSSRVEILKNHLMIDATQVNKIELNSADYSTLVKHPYINSNVANSILKIRTQIGNYKNVDQIKQSNLIDEALFKKIEPYIIVK